MNRIRKIPYQGVGEFASSIQELFWVAIFLASLHGLVWLIDHKGVPW